jgi:alkylated DNA nucleotide flippase Atl1
MDEPAIQRVLLAAERVPSGRLATYGDLGWAAGVGPRQVGTIMRERGGEVAWWRIVSAAGVLPPHLAGRAAAHWDEEGIPHAEGRLLLRACRVDRTQLREDDARASRAYEEPAQRGRVGRRHLTPVQATA